MNLTKRLAPLTRALCAVVLVSPLIGADQLKFEEASVKRADTGAACRIPWTLAGSHSMATP
jgi:hypothetical protein